MDDRSDAFRGYLETCRRLVLSSDFAIVARPRRNKSQQKVRIYCRF